MLSAGLGGSEQFLGEGGLQGTEALVHRLQFGLLGCRKLGAGMDELLVIDVEQFRLFRVEIQFGLMIVQILHPLEQLGVKENEVVVGREQRRGLGVRRLERIVRVCAVDSTEREVRPLQKQARALKRDERVVERRLSRIVGDRQDFALLLGHSG